MRDLTRAGLQVVGVDCEPEHEGFRSVYGESRLCPNPDHQPDAWVAFMIALARELGARPVIIPAADIFVTALGRHAQALAPHYIFSMESIAVQARLATKDQQYALAAAANLPIPRTVAVTCLAEVEAYLATVRFPCLMKPHHQREWEQLPAGNPLRRVKLVTAENAEEMLDWYAHTSSLRPEVVLQEIVAGGDDAKYCYLSVYGQNSRRLGYCVVRELRAHPIGFGSASVVEPVVDEEIATICDTFLRRVGYVGICEIEVKRDVRDHGVRLIEANPRYSVTADAAPYAGVPIGLLHYQSLLGQEGAEQTTTRFGFRHVALRRELAAVHQYTERGISTWVDLWDSYQTPLEFFDFDLEDPRPTWSTVNLGLRAFLRNTLKSFGL
ncbi:MAG: hypothetical protein KGK08_13545 [Acidobacteriota bacterium]|nr:hypothetical protein [Acidobacteriota bacterium]